MTKTVSVALAAIAAALIAAAPAGADEAWDTDLGRMYWEESVGDMAVFALEGAGGAVAARVYLPGLAADVMGGRGTYDGYWIAMPDGSPGCGAQLTGPDGTKSPLWGTVTITFVNDGFPSDWAGFYGECFYGAGETLTGVALYGE